MTLAMVVCLRGKKMPRRKNDTSRRICISFFIPRCRTNILAQKDGLLEAYCVVCGLCWPISYGSLVKDNHMVRGLSCVANFPSKNGLLRAVHLSASPIFSVARCLSFGIVARSSSTLEDEWDGAEVPFYLAQVPGNLWDHRAPKYLVN